ncbi:hypothetical protein AXG93_2381s1100 [Marchantia polymorpha subsp. ruderalis]|uniref:TRUD domain-containing protein n=1 Tax=Marchantia polymorpha subsp. ruderalis TaxID=1480154 RepID=A0A176VNC2_MARPO|nr:hypothetical protein AXG93_2381s1100 [Marchantia polymorpha subsp. ruderalis]
MHRICRDAICKLGRTQIFKGLTQGQQCIEAVDSLTNWRIFGSKSSTVATSALTTSRSADWCNDVSVVSIQVNAKFLQSTAWTDDVMNEEEVGILCYMNNIPGFRGTLKQRYSDFVVNEIDLTGQVVRLTSLTPPPEKNYSEDTKVHVKEVPQECEVAPEVPVVEDANHLEAFKALVGEEDAMQLEGLLAKIAENKELKDLAPILLAPDSDKAHRAASRLISDTVDGPGLATEKCVRIRYFSSGGGAGSRRDRGNKRGGDWKEKQSKRQKRGPAEAAPFDSRGRDDWLKPKFLKFHLFKENKNTQDALMIIGRMLGVQPKSFSFAGTKDKRAVTTQQVTVYKQPAAKLALLNKKLMGVNLVTSGEFPTRFNLTLRIAVGLWTLHVNPFHFLNKSVEGHSDSEENELCKKSEEDVEKSLHVVVKEYHSVRLDVKDEVFYHAVAARVIILYVSAGNVIAEDDGVISEASESLKERGFVNYYGLQRFGSGSVPTHTVGAALLRGEWKTAVDLILQPREDDILPLRLGLSKFVHSYQSYMWNHAVSHRLKTYGVDQVVEGDLVYREDLEGGANSEVVESPPRSEKVEDISEEVAEEEAEIPDETVDVAREALSKVKYVTAEDVTSKMYSITDVVLPLPGSSVMYPKNSTADVYQELASKDSIDLSKCSHKVKKVIMYNDVTESLIESDLDVITKVSGDDKEKVPGSVEGGAFKALQLRFSLQTSSYATMAIRELLKTSTSVAFHKTLNEETEKSGLH